jgi:hypothetical protein
MQARVLAWLGVVVMACAAGCATQWERGYKPTGPTAAPLPAGTPVRLREVPFERVQETLRTLTEEAAKSDTHPEDWPQERKDAAKATLLRGLQVTEDPSRVRVLGRSDFSTTDHVRPDDGTLEQFARKVGATTVVWASMYRGRTDTIVDQPVTQWRTATVAGPRGRLWTYNESSTIWVPVSVSADEFAFVAFFLREDGR